MKQAVILAGGLGTRMLPRTERVPKLLLPVAGRPFAAWLLARLAAAGFDEALLCIAHLGEMIRAEVGDGRAHGIAVRYADEGPALLGTASALRRALPALAPAFLVTYGDFFLPFDYAAPLADLALHAGAQGTMAVFKNDDRWDRSNTQIEGEAVLRYEKRARDAAPDPALDHIDYGALAFRKVALEPWRHEPKWDLAVAQTALAATGRMRAVVAAERFYEIGSPEGLQSLTYHLAARTDLRSRKPLA